MLRSYGYVDLLCRADPSLNNEYDYTNSNPIACVISCVNLTRYFLGNTRKALVGQINAGDGSLVVWAQPFWDA